MRALAPLLAVPALAACVAVATVPQQPAEPQPLPDLCRAAEYQVLVGQSRSVLNTMMLPAGTRVIGPNDAVTADYNPQRANIEIGTTGRIEKVSCY